MDKWIASLSQRLVSSLSHRDYFIDGSSLFNSQFDEDEVTKCTISPVDFILSHSFHDQELVKLGEDLIQMTQHEYSARYSDLSTVSGICRIQYQTVKCV